MAKLSPTFFQQFDNNGDILVGGKLYTFEAGTATNKVTYKNEDESVVNTNPIVLDSSGRADVWLDSGAYKFILRTSADVLIAEIDNITGAASNVFGSSVTILSTNTNITSVYQNNLINCTAVLTLTLLEAATAEEGFIISVKNTSAGDVTIDPDGSELIDGNATLLLPAGQSVMITCNGTGWISSFVLDINALEAETTINDAADYLVMYDDSASAARKVLIQEIVEITRESCYPVGTYFSSTSATNPATLLGFGTWVEVENESLIGAGDTYTAGASYGSPTTTLSIANLPAHTHEGRDTNRGGSGDQLGNLSVGSDLRDTAANTSSVGSGTPVTTLSPVRGAYIWYRTA